MDALESWTDFNVAMVGATAALAGLVIVASSVNIAEIVKASTITARLAAGIAALVLALTASALTLIPAITPPVLGACLIGAAAIAGTFQVHASIVIVRDPSPEAQARGVKVFFGFVPVAAYVIAGVVMFADPSAGLVTASIGCLLAIVTALVVSWVALVEVLR